jgi:abequosyltransferase
MALKISVCMPIFNCADYVEQALDSILPQLDERMEVIVYDGGSTDGTADRIASYTNSWPNLRYYRSERRGGIDADMATCVGYARGEYCWLFSGDDVMRPGAIARVLDWIALSRDVYICKHTICSKEMEVFHDHLVLDPDQVFAANLANLEERREWFRRAVTTEAFFSFMSGLIVRREKWQNGTLPDAFKGSCWGHVARLFSLAPTGLTVCYVAEVWLDKRGGNDSFADKGVVNRFRIGIEGYSRLADAYFGGDSIEARHIRRVLRNEFPLKMLQHTRILCLRHPETEDRKLLDRLAGIAYGDNSPAVLAKRMIYFAIPDWLFLAAAFVYRAIKNTARALRHG